MEYLAFALFRVPLALPVVQILAVDLGTDVLPALALGAEKPDPDTMTRPPRRRTDRLLDAGLLLRSYLFLGALKHPVVGRVLVLLHAQPETRWTVERLASEVAVSRSVLAQRFTDVLGVSPMKYLTQWRLQMAADLLRTTSMSVAAIAARVGYEAEPAFSRAFKRATGSPPTAWRREAVRS